MAPPEFKGNIGLTRLGSSTEVRQVQNVALADATAKAGVSPWTPTMLKVSSLRLKRWFFSGL